MHRLQPDVYATPTAWIEGTKGKGRTSSPGLLAKRVQALMKAEARHAVLSWHRRGRPARGASMCRRCSTCRRSCIHGLGIHGPWEILGWLSTSQERLGELVGGLDDRRIDSSV